MTEEWASIGEQLSGPRGRERDIAEWQACVHVVKSINAYAPGAFDGRVFTGENSECHRKQSVIARARSQTMDIHAARAFAEGDPSAFGEWRCGVTEFEAVEATKLQTLVWVLRTLYRLRDLEGADTGPIDRIATIIGDFLTGEWNLNPTEIPLKDDSDYRTWASRCGRHYDLLPMSWRYV